jgi:hypothetical protein
MGGSWAVAENTAVFTPVEMWQAGQRYELRVNASFSGEANFSMGNDFTSVFTMGEDLEKPYLRAAYACEKDQSRRELTAEIPGPFYENSSWEKDTTLILVFSEPVDSASVYSSLGAEGAPSVDLESAPGVAAEHVFSFRERPAWQAHFLFRLQAGVRDAAGNESDGIIVFRVCADGPFSKPPSLVGMRIPMAPGKPEGEQEIAVYTINDIFKGLPLENREGSYIFEEETPIWIDLYFDTASGAEPDLFSLMDIFRVDATNNAVYFSPAAILNDNFSAPVHPVWEHHQRVEVRGILINRINSGTVSFIIGAGLSDTLENHSDTVFRISLLK